MTTTPRRRTAARRPLPALAPLPPPFTDLLSDRERRQLRKTGMTDADILAMCDRAWLDVLGEQCVKVIRAEKRAKKRLT